MTHFRVFAQRIDNQSHFDSGTASTVFFQPDAPPEPPLSNQTLQEFQFQGWKMPLTALRIYELDSAAVPAWHDCDVFLILCYLIDSTEFDFATYTSQDHPIFSDPKPASGRRQKSYLDLIWAKLNSAG